MLTPLSTTPLTNSRAGETKIGDAVTTLKSYDHLVAELNHFSGRYCILGIPEDIGPVANLGKRGAAGTFEDFLGYFLNMQDNAFLNASNIMILGAVKVDDLMKKSEKLDPKKENDLYKLRTLVEEIDKRVAPIVQAIVTAGKIPVVIGGGHNNAYPVIKGTAMGLKDTAIGVVNIDPHADLRAIEGRHSGNGFSYAIADGYLDKYFPIGLHLNYNNTEIWNKLDSDKKLFNYITNEDILLKDLGTKEIVAQVAKFMKDSPMGIEIDVDGIRFAESSARTPVGFSESKVRKLLMQLANNKNIVYFNVSEGIPGANQTGKLIAYLVADFIREHTIVIK